MDAIKTLAQWIAQSHNTVFFGGAGVSTESGIPDFRSVDGLYHQKFDYPPETIISHSFYKKNPSYFFRFYREKMLPLGFSPNITHLKLAQLEQEGKLSAVITQNIDGLHQKAGSKHVLELHGSVLRKLLHPLRQVLSSRICQAGDRHPPGANAEALSNQMWCSTKRRWMKTACAGPLPPSPPLRF